MRSLPEEGKLYRHFKGTVYRVICIARDSETLEESVVYENTSDPSKKFVRPLTEFMSRVDREKYPDVPEEFRFTEVSSGGDGAGDIRETPAEPAYGNDDEAALPLVEFLDAEGNEAKLGVLQKRKAMITDEMINAMAASLDTEIRPGRTEDRYEELKEYILTMIRYEGVRLRS